MTERLKQLLITFRDDIEDISHRDKTINAILTPNNKIYCGCCGKEVFPGDCTKIIVHETWIKL